MTPVNLAAHEHLLSCGYEHEYVPPDFDDGDPENGPGTWGYPGFDVYTSDEDQVFICENGTTDRGLICPACTTGVDIRVGTKPGDAMCNECGHQWTPRR
jgi:hypothetical protein